MQALSVAGVGNERLRAEYVPLMNMPKGPGIQICGLQILNGAWGIAIRAATALHHAVQEAKLEAVRGIIACKKPGQVLVFLVPDMAYAMNDGHLLTCAHKNASLITGAENYCIWREFKRSDARAEGIMIAMDDIDGNAIFIENSAGIPKRKLGSDAALFLVIYVASQDKEIRFFHKAKLHKPFQGSKGGLMQHLAQMASGIFFQSFKWCIQMQISSVDIADLIHSGLKNLFGVIN